MIKYKGVIFVSRWDNKIVGDKETYLSRYIASWRNKGGYFDIGGEFDEWLKSEGLTDEEIENAYNMATCGKLELEVSAMPFIKAQKEEYKLYEQEES